MTRADRVVLALALASLAGLYRWTWFGTTPGSMVLVRADNFERIMPLALDSTLDVAGPLGSSRVLIASGSARFGSAPCPTRRCMHAGEIRLGGEMIACLPNRVSLRVIGNGEGYDAVNF